MFARVKSPFIDLVNNVDAARQSDGRLQAMQGMAAGANAYQAGSPIANAAKGAGSGALFSAEAGIGFKSSSSSADGSSTVSRGSTIQGGGNVNLTSTSGDIHVVQGNLSAGNTLALDSAGDILLEAGKAHLQDKSKSNNAGAEVGVGVSVGAQTGVYVYAEASVGSSKSNSDSSTWQNTTLTGQNISLKAEGDATLRGATATADRIDVKTGGTLTIESLQDIAESMSKDSQFGGRVQVSIGTAWDASGYASASKANGSYKGVGQQSGLFAGDGGYHVDAGHVNLIGGAIASTNGANSELTAESFTFTDLKNEMDYRASSASISGGFGSGGEKATDANGNPAATPNAAGQFKDIGSNVANGKFGNADGSNFSGGVPMTSSGSDSSTTYATLTEGNITIGGKKVTAAELGVNTDASKAHEAISTLPDLQKLMQEQQAMSSAAGTVVATSKQVAGDVFAYKSEQAKQAFEESLKKNNAEEWANYSKLDSNGKAGYLQNASQEYREALKWGTGGEYSRALDAVTTAIVGSVAGQGGGQVVSNALAPYAAALIGDRFDTNHGKDPDAVMQLLSHAVLGALLAEANGGSAGNGALAAGAGEVAAQYIADYLYPEGLSNLTEQQKQTVLALSQAVGAIAGGAGGNGLAGAALGSNIAQNSVENNRLLHPSEVKFLAKKETVDSYIAFMASHGVVLTAEEARSSLNRFASSKEDNSWSAILGQDPLTSEFLSSMSKGLTYQDSTGKSHAFFVSSTTELKDPTINLNALYDARFDPVVAQYLDSIGANNRQPTDLNRELFGYGQLAGYSYADGQASAWGDIKLIANSVVSFGQSVLYSGTSDQIGPYDELKLKANLQLLLKDQGRWAEAGFVEGAEWATTQRLMWSGMALGEAGGFLGGNLIKHIKLPWRLADDLAKAKSPPIASWAADSEAGTSTKAPSGDLTGQPELPPRNAHADQVRAIDRQNEAAVALAKYGENVEQLPNTKKNAANPDLKINGQIADVLSPITNSPISVLMSIRGKVEKQAPTIVVNLQDSVITISQLEGVLRANPVPGLRAVYIMKNGEITVMKGVQ
ncbi:hemagglutinin repeat-containing protein [Stenotrophomonas sp. VV52]|uniref:hemagglutinin repeat-containing protein n=1 Tax=Stenotrophomonas sp. VV52 TaxID=2066958 RepID=UPI00209BE1F5|nr:hemagglutinin repeat-containing protein [Stenotrophomonas sp. VV52]